VRAGRDSADRYCADRTSRIADALRRLPANGFIIDGEVVVTDDRGRPNFGWLQDDLAEGRRNRLLYFSFDLLWLDGFVYAQAREHGLEGTLSKVRNAPYRSGRGDYWIKVKLAAPKVVVVDVVPESTAGISALRLGEMRGGKLMYAGKVGTGWGRDKAADMRAKLDRLIRPKSPLDERIRKTGHDGSSRVFKLTSRSPRSATTAACDIPLFAVSLHGHYARDMLDRRNAETGAVAERA
jgi:ATP-dependent DNA ligase